MNVARLKRMVEVLLEVEAKHAGHFHMDRWYGRMYALGRQQTDSGSVKRMECGTYACALGWYCIFESLEPKIEGYSVDRVLEFAGEHFGLDDKSHAVWLFLPDAYVLPDQDDEEADIKPRHVINRIREMIGEGV